MIRRPIFSLRRTFAFSTKQQQQQQQQQLNQFRFYSSHAATNFKKTSAKLPLKKRQSPVHVSVGEAVAVPTRRGEMKMKGHNNNKNKNLVISNDDENQNTTGNTLLTMRSLYSLYSLYDRESGKRISTSATFTHTRARARSGAAAFLNTHNNTTKRNGTDFSQTKRGLHHDHNDKRDNDTLTKNKKRGSTHKIAKEVDAVNLADEDNGDNSERVRGGRLPCVLSSSVGQSKVTSAIHLDAEEKEKAVDRERGQKLAFSSSSSSSKSTSTSDATSSVSPKAIDGVALLCEHGFGFKRVHTYIFF